MIKRFLTLGFLEAVARALNWSMGLILAFIFDAKTYGIITLFIAIEGLLIGFYMFGLDKVLLRFTPEFNRKDLLGKVIKIWLINSLLVSLVIAFIVTYSDQLKSSLFGGVTVSEIVCLLIIIAAMSYQKFITAFYRALGDFWGFAFNRLGIQTVRVFSVIIIAILFQNYQAYLLGSMFAIVFLLLNIFFLKNTFNSVDDSNRVQAENKVLLIFAWPFVPHMISGAVLSYIDRIMLQSMQGLESVGNYGLGYLLGSAIVFVYGVLATFYEPYVYKHIHAPSRVQKMQTIYLYLLLLFASLGGISIIIGVDVLGDAISDNGYSNVGEIARLVLIAHLILAFYLISNYQLTLVKKTAFIALATLLAGVVNVVFNFILIPIYGEVGAAYSTVVSFLLLAIFAGYKSLIIYKNQELDSARLLLVIVLLLITVTCWIDSNLFAILQFSLLTVVCSIYLIKNLNLKQLVGE